MKLQSARATMVLAAVMAGVFVIELIGFVMTDAQQTVIRLGAIIPGTLTLHGAWRLLAAIFLHGGFFHLILNLWVFIQLGYGFESIFGSRRFLIAFFLGGLGASIVSAMFVNPYGSVGASGAIFAVQAAFVMLLFRNVGWKSAPWARRLAAQLAFWSVVTVILGFFAPHIDNAAHVGGLLTGGAIGFWFTRA